MLSNEIKAKIFSLYLGQKVLNDGLGEYLYLLTADMLAKIYDTDYLLLKSVKQLLPEHLIACYHLHSAAIAYDYTQDYADVLTCANHWISMDGYETLFKYSTVNDYLRALGYATPITLLVDGAVRTIGVDEMVEAGVIKLEGE